MKGKRRILILLAATVLMLGLSGCAENQIPDMTEEEMQAMGEFVAKTMMKYDTGHQSRLMDLSSLEEAGGNMEDILAPEQSGAMAPVDDTPIVDSAGNVQTDPANESFSAEEVMGLPEGVTVTFQGYGIYDAYPEDSEAFVVSAAQGKKLLVLEFSIMNASGQEQAVDMLSKDISYKVKIDRKAVVRPLTTFLPDDMASYGETLPAGGSASAVLLVEMDAAEAERISFISLSMKSESKSCTIQLYGDGGQ